MTSPIIRIGALAALLWSVCAAHAAEAGLEWPQFRGPSGAGRPLSDRPGPIEFGPEKNLQWSVALVGGHSSPCISGNKLFVTGSEKAAKKLFVVCVDRSNGKLLWKRERTVPKFEATHEISNPATATPATDGKAVFVYFGSYGVAAYDFEGQELWTKPLPLAVNRMGFGSGTSPIVKGDLVIVDVHAGKDSHLLALHCRDGKLAWKAENPLFNEGWSTPVVWREGEEEVVGMLNAQRFCARRLKDGSEKWWIPGLPNQICATPAVGDGVLFITGTGVLGDTGNLIQPPGFDELVPKYDADKDGKITLEELPESILVADRQSTDGAGNMSLRKFLSFSGGKGQKFGREDWAKVIQAFDGFAKGAFMTTRVMAVRVGGSGDVSGSAVMWSEGKGIPEVPSPLFLGDRLYLVKAGGVVICRDTASGKSIFEERLGAVGGYYASPVAVGGRIYAASDRGTVVVFEGRDALKVLARNEFKEPIMATPAIVDGKLYVRSANHLYAFNGPQ